MKRFARSIVLAVALVASWAVVVLHRAVCVPPDLAHVARSATADPGHWYPRDRFGLNQLFVSGSPYDRGLAEGKLTRDLMEREETELNQKFVGFFPNPVVRWGFLLGLMRWFWGVESVFEPPMLEEMAGVAQSASPRFDGLLDPFTRQIAYHGLHEVGQMFVDFRGSDRGCTVFALPVSVGKAHSWVVGRNFDFEGGRIFDEEKIVKWVSPDRGHRFVAVTWAGMVGVVTGVNDRGVYVSINAAGSTDFRRFGLPTTLVALDALQFSENAEQAVERISRAKTFITDIFVVADEAHVFRVEKSPRRVSAAEIPGAAVVTNHLLAPEFSGDRINGFRRTELTSESRALRGEALLAQRKFPLSSATEGVSQALRFLRDKRDSEGQALSLGNRSAIDSLIASHSVIYDAKDRLLYVSKGPSLSGAFVGFDLRKTFATSGPATTVAPLPEDADDPPARYREVKEAERLVDEAARITREGRCDAALSSLERALALHDDSSEYYAALGDARRCKHETDLAKAAWEEALRRHPAYAEDRRALKERLNR